MTAIRFSICVPTYNFGQFIPASTCTGAGSCFATMAC